jgi:type III secretion protein V
VTVLARIGRLRGGSDVLLAALALALVSALVAPLPPWLLDLGVAANLALAATVLVVALFARDPLRLASLPSLLLFTTLLRLALEVSATRLVLARGDPGRVIQAFGRVVVSGSYVVGAVVFAILTLVQILVVAKGAERVAEVAARFTLDALPGKQMSIDADLRAGLVDGAEARRRRRALEREGQLHGAMDGALKFVKGDALAGVAIVLVNVVGGLVAGLARGLPLEAAARRYALLAIGDGLAAQIPALLVSIAAAVAVTRVAAEEEGGSLSEELGAQLFSDPRALAAVAALCGALAALPGLPALPFVVLGVGAVSGAALQARRERRAAPGPERERGAPAPALAGSPDPALPPSPSPLVLELSAELEDLVLGAGAPGRGIVPDARAEVARELGVPLPPLAVRPSTSLPGGAWRLLVDEVPAAAGRCPASEAIALLSLDELEAVGIPARPELDPVTGCRVGVISVADSARAAALGPVRGPGERLGAALAAALRAHAHLLLGVQDVQGLLEGLEATHPALVRELPRQVPTALLAEVLRQLLEEGVAIRPLPALLETVLEAAPGTRSAAALAERCRRTLRRQIAHDHAASGVLDALLIDPAAEAALRAGLTGPSASPDAAAVRALLDALSAELSARPGRHPVVLTGSDLRRPVRQLLAARHPAVAVLAYEELPPALPVRPVGALGRPA